MMDKLILQLVKDGNIVGHLIIKNGEVLYQRGNDPKILKWVVGMSFDSFDIITNINYVTEEDVDAFMGAFEKDYSAVSEKPLLVPRNNREYWLFTEIWQRLTEFLTCEVYDDTDNHQRY